VGDWSNSLPFSAAIFFRTSNIFYLLFNCAGFKLEQAHSLKGRTIKKEAGLKSQPR